MMITGFSGKKRYPSSNQREDLFKYKWGQIHKITKVMIFLL